MRKVILFDHNNYTEFTLHDIMRKIEEVLTSDSSSDSTKILVTLEEVEVDG